MSAQRQTVDVEMQLTAMRVVKLNALIVAFFSTMLYYHQTPHSPCQDAGVKGTSHQAAGHRVNPIAECTMSVRQTR